MLKIVRNWEGDEYIIWSVLSDNAIKMKVVSNDKIWIENGVITKENKPQSRQNETDDEYMENLKKVMLDGSKNSSDLFEFDISEEIDGSLNFAIKEIVKGTTSKMILLKINLSPNRNFYEENMILLKEISESIFEINKSIGMYEKKEKVLEEQIESLSKDIRNMIDYKNNFQNEMISKMCIVLNTKKREIKRLQDMLESRKEDSEDDIPSSSSSKSAFIESEEDIDMIKIMDSYNNYSNNKRKRKLKSSDPMVKIKTAKKQKEIKDNIDKNNAKTNVLENSLLPNDLSIKNQSITMEPPSSTVGGLNNQVRNNFQIAKKSSKFFAEDSDDESNCLDYI